MREGVTRMRQGVRACREKKLGADVLGKVDSALLENQKRKKKKENGEEKPGCRGLW